MGLEKPVPAVKVETVPPIDHAAQIRSFAFVVVEVVPALRLVVEPVWEAVWSTVLLRPENSSIAYETWVEVVAEKLTVNVSDVVSVPTSCKVLMTLIVSEVPFAAVMSTCQVLPLVSVTDETDTEPLEKDRIRALPALGAAEIARPERLVPAGVGVP